MRIPTKQIKIGERIREDMGDLESLAKSIQDRGLINPITIDENMNLIAGHRRLQAVKLLGWEEVEVKTFEELTEMEKRLIELEENTKRKDFTEYERSKNLDELVKVAKKVLKDEFSANVAKNPKGGRPQKSDSETKVAERLGIPQRTINDAKQHVKAVEENPNLIHLPKMDAIKTSKEPTKVELLNKAYEDFPQLKEISMPLENIIQAAENLRQLPPNEQEALIEKSMELEKQHKKEMDLIDEEYKEQKKIANLIAVSIKMRDVVTEERIQAWLNYTVDRDSVSNAAQVLQQAIDEMTYLKSELEQYLNGPRKVVGIREIK